MAARYSVVDVDAVEGAGPGGRVRFLRRAVGATAFGFNWFELGPETSGPEHDETESGQEEVYLTLSGGGTLEIDGETVEMKPGRYFRVPPEAKRRPAAGPEGMSFLVIGGVPGGVYQPWTPPEA